jgi:uncharacterized protein with HEPN domain
MKRSTQDSKLYLEDILDAINKIDDYIASTRSLTEFKRNSLVFDAVVRNLEIIGEAVKNLSGDLKKNHSEIEWKNIAGMRDILAHAYFGIDHSIVWDIVRTKLPELKAAVSEMLKEI